MFTPFIDLHTHTVRSDGRLTPHDLVDAAYDAGIRVMSITDHNFTEDLTELRKTVNGDMTLIQGAEISALYTDGTGQEHELHIVALGFDPDAPEMREMLAHNQPERRPYINAILARLREECGIDLGTYDEIQAKFPETKYIGRMALARLMTQKGITKNVDEAFDVFLGSHGQRRAYVKNPLRYYTLEETVRRIIRSGGTPILAHLLYYDMDDGNRTGGEEKERLVSYFKQLTDKYGSPGGMEVYYTRYNSAQERVYLLGLCRRYNLMISAGSDYHQQEEWETLHHRTSWSVCSELLEHLGVEVTCDLRPSDLLVVSGFSGVGKGAVCEKLEGKFVNGKQIAGIRSVTSRASRTLNENYTFVSSERFAELVSQNQLLEHNGAYGKHGYGTPVWEVRTAIEEGKIPLLEIDRVGLTNLLTDGKINPKHIKSVFLTADAAEVARRLYLRGTDSEPSIRSRLETAMQESACVDLYDAVIENRVVAQAAEAVVASFEGVPLESGFDPGAFQKEMRDVLTKAWRRPSGLKYDPVEDTPEYHAAMESIGLQLGALFPEKKDTADVSKEKWIRKKELLAKQGIYWRTPEEMNPDDP